MIDYQIKLPKGTRTLSGEIIAERHGSDIVDGFLKWLDMWQPDCLITVQKIRDQIIEIEKEYGIDRVE